MLVVVVCMAAVVVKVMILFDYVGQRMEKDIAEETSHSKTHAQENKALIYVVLHSNVQQVNDKYWHHGDENG